MYRLTYPQHAIDKIDLNFHIGENGNVQMEITDDYHMYS